MNSYFLWKNHEPVTQANILKRLGLATWDAVPYEKIKIKAQGFTQEDWLIEKKDYWSIYIPCSDKYLEIRWDHATSNFDLSKKNTKVIKTPEKKMKLLTQMVQHAPTSMTNPQFFFEPIVSNKSPTLECVLSTMSYQNFVPYKTLKEKAEGLSIGDWLLVKTFWAWKIFFPSTDKNIYIEKNWDNPPLNFEINKNDIEIIKTQEEKEKLTIQVVSRKDKQG